MSKRKNNFKLKIREREQSDRQLKVSQLINESLVKCLRKGKMLDPRLFDVPITITKVNISADLKIADCYFLPFNTKLSADELMEILEASKYAIRKFVTKEINLRYSPELRFHYDYGFENAAIVDSLLNKNKK